ncbi:MAG TPA: hypothetical protein PKA37_13100, partial [Planctomycetota bacterium]|nr:hypothetical protein [Planctomycetota bacterium]
GGDLQAAVVQNDDLVLAVLEHREEQFQAMFEASMNRHGNEGRTPIQAFFGALRDWFGSPGFRGCMFINSRVELADPQHPASQFAAGHKVRFHRQLHDILLAAAGVNIAEAAAGALALLVEGAIVTAVMQQSPAAADVAERAVMSLIAGASRP